MASASSFHQYTSSETIRVIVGEGDNRVRHNLYVTLLYDKSRFFKDKIDEFQRAHMQAYDDRRNAGRRERRGGGRDRAAIGNGNGQGNGNRNGHRNPFVEIQEDQTIFLSDDENATPAARPLPSPDAPDAIIDLPTVHPPAFRQFVQWLHDKPFDLTDLNLVVSTYLLGHFFSCEELRNDLIDAVRAHYAECGTRKVDMAAMLRLSEALPPHGEGNKGKNQLLELLVAQLTYKVLMRGWMSYNKSDNLKRLMDSSIEVTMWHLNWIHRLNTAGGGSCGFVNVKVKREGERLDDEDGDVKDRVGGPYGTPKRGRKRIKVKGECDEPVNPGAMGGCMFHSHKDKRSLCKTPDLMLED